MLKQYVNPGEQRKAQLVQRPRMEAAELADLITTIFDRVQSGGDEAIKEYTTQFDGVDIAELQVTSEEIEQAALHLDEELRRAIDVAYANIMAFHQSQINIPRKVETTEGVECWQESRPIERVGLYIPGGSAPLFSTVLMLGVPARVAGCDQVVLTTPPQRDGSVHPAIIYAAQRCGIDVIIKAGGAQAIAGLVFGTTSIPPVYKIYGPGNQYVMAAKLKAMDYGVAMDLPAGPSEVLVYADASSHPEFVAADLLSQAEHGPDSQVVLVTPDHHILEGVENQLRLQLTELPRRDIAERALAHGYAVVFEDVERSFDFINEYAPEHFIILSDNAEDYLPLVRNAGSVFVGHLTPESAGDYASGTNHTLPTAAYARSYSGVSLDSFIKKITFQKISSAGIQKLGDTIMTMARHEQLQGHAQAVKVRIDYLKTQGANEDA